MKQTFFHNLRDPPSLPRRGRADAAVLYKTRGGFSQGRTMPAGDQNNGMVKKKEKKS